MNKLAHYLQEHLRGEVTVAAQVRERYMHDASIFRAIPALVAFPMDESDIRKTARFSWQLAERGRIMPITVRGGGTDFTGASIGHGIMLVTPVHMNKILELDAKNGLVVVESGINFEKLQQSLKTHGRFIPAYPASIEDATIGGSVANNAGGELSIKYGNMSEYVRSLGVVLANGELIQTARLSKRELSKKMGLSSFEGEIYRNLDALIEEYQDLIKNFKPNWPKNVSGYNIFDVKAKDGSFDLTPLIIGAQGTLGLISEVTLSAVEHNPETSLVAIYVHDFSHANQIMKEVKSLKPSAFEVIDRYTVQSILDTNPNYLKGVLPSRMPELTLFVEFDDISKKQSKNVKKLTHALDHLGVDYRIELDDSEKQNIWKLRHSVGSIHLQNDTRLSPLPIIDDGVIDSEKLEEYLSGIYEILKKYDIKIAVWGHIGQGNLHMQPLLDIAQLGDRQKIFRLMKEYHELILSLGGSITGEYNDGRLRGPYVKDQFGDELYELFLKIKAVFDPFGILNPGVKVGVTLDDTMPLLRDSYSLPQHFPRS